MKPRTKLYYITIYVLMLMLYAPSLSGTLVFVMLTAVLLSEMTMTHCSLYLDRLEMSQRASMSMKVRAPDARQRDFWLMLVFTFFLFHQAPWLATICAVHMVMTVWQVQELRVVAASQA